MMGSPRRYLSDMLFLLGSERRKLWWILPAFFLASLLDLAGIGLVGGYIAVLTQPEGISSGPLSKVVEFFGIGANRESVIILSLALIGLFVTKAGVGIVLQREIFKFSYNQTALLQARSMNAIQHIRYDVFIRRNSAEYVQVARDYVGQYAASLLTLLRMISEGIVALVIFLLFAVLSGLALVFLLALGAVLFVGFDKIFRHRLRRAGALKNVGNLLVVQGIHEGTAGFKQTRILGCEAHFLSQVQKGSRQAARASAFIGVVGIIPRYMVEIAIIIFVITLVGVTMTEEMDIKPLFPVFGMLGVAAIRLGPIIDMFITGVATIRSRQPAVKLLMRELVDMDKVTLGVRTPVTQEGRHSFKLMEVSSVGFSYEGVTQPTLDSISLTLSKGEAIGLIGPSGSGKTTLVDVMLGLLDYQSGQILYNGQPLSESRQSWWANVAYLPQEVFLMDASLRENLTLGIQAGEIDGEHLNKALRRARLDDLVGKLPQGVETLLGERGVRLSGGQRQRVALARAFYHGRSVLVLDEATSALDNKAEREIVEEIKHLKGQTTMIVIAHRLTTVQYCDRIYCLENGRIVDSGTYNEVILGKDKDSRVDG